MIHQRTRRADFKAHCTALLLAGLALPALPSAARAQSGTPADDGAVGADGDIVVTAQKREERLQDIPVAISVVSGAALDDRGGVNVQSLQQMVPSLNFQNSATGIDSALFLRGVGTINFSIAAEPSVGFVVDGVTFARSGEALGDLYDVERVEVLRGPQGTLFGKNASAGVISIVSRRPGDTLGGYIEASVATDEEYKLRGALDLPLGGSVRTRITGTYANFEGNIRNLALDRTVNGYERYGFRGIVEADAGDTLKLTLIGDYSKQNSDCCALVVGTVPTGPLAGSLPGVDIRGAATREIRQDILTRTRERAWGVSLQADLDVGAAGTLTSITAYRKWRNEGFNDGDSRDLVYAVSGGHGIDQYGPQPSRTFTQELRIASPGGQTLEYVVGGFYYDAKQTRTYQRDVTVCTSTTLPEVAPGLAPCAPGSSTYEYPTSVATFGSTIRSAAAFANLTWNVADRMRLIGGLRYTHDWVKGFHDRVGSPIPGPGVLTTGSGWRLKTKNDNLSGKVGVQYDFTPDFMTYATYSRGYKGPAFNIYFNQNASQLDPIAAETANAYEVGSKWVSADRSASLNFAAFYAQYDNFQANNFVLLNGVVITTLTNAGKVSTKGFELEGTLRPSRNFVVTGGLAYTDAQIDRFLLPPGSPPTATDRRGERLPLAPAWKGTVGFDWTHETGAGFNVVLGGQLSLTSDQVSALEADPTARRALTIDGYAIVDANIKLVDQDDRWSLNLVGRNLTDKSYPTIISAGGPGGSYLYQIPRNADRYFGATLRVNFGG